MVSTSDVLDRHLKAFAEYDVDGVLADYSPDAVLFVPTITAQSFAAMIKPKG